MAISKLWGINTNNIGYMCILSRIYARIIGYICTNYRVYVPTLLGIYAHVYANYRVYMPTLLGICAHIIGYICTHICTNYRVYMCMDATNIRREPTNMCLGAASGTLHASHLCCCPSNSTSHLRVQTNQSITHQSSL